MPFKVLVEIIVSILFLFSFFVCLFLGWVGGCWVESESESESGQVSHECIVSVKCIYFFIIKTGLSYCQLNKFCSLNQGSGL